MLNREDQTLIKAILFDFDGVLTIDTTGSQSILNYLAETSRISIDVLKTEYYKFNNELLYGKITHNDMWQDFCKGIGTDLHYDLLIDAFRNTPLDFEMIDFAQELKKTYKIGMITDNKCDRIEEILDHYKLTSLFDVVSVSARYRSGKQDQNIFEKTVCCLNVSYSECIFIDNSEKNLVVPQRLGMDTILFDDENRNIETFKEQILCYIKQANKLC